MFIANFVCNFKAIGEYPQAKQYNLISWSNAIALENFLNMCENNNSSDCSAYRFLNLAMSFTIQNFDIVHVLLLFWLKLQDFRRYEISLLQQRRNGSHHYYSYWSWYDLYHWIEKNIKNFFNSMTHHNNFYSFSLLVKKWIFF